MIGKSSATSSPSVIGARRRNELSKPRVSHGLGHYTPTETLVLWSDNRLIFQSRRFRQACRDYRLQQEFITLFTPEQNGIIERFCRSLKEECVWQHTFPMFQDARRIIRDWVQWYNPRWPHSAWATGVRSNTGHNNQLRWLDFRGALQGLTTIETEQAEPQTAPTKKVA
jgi:transposase InsO family protein